MGFLQNIFESKEEKEYKIELAQVSNPLMNKIGAFEEKEIREFFKVILDAAERSLRGILFKAPEEFDFNKQLSKEDIDFWLRKASLALVAFSYYFFSGGEDSPLVQSSYRMYWQRMFDSYNEIFSEKITIKEIDYCAAGLKEDTEKGYSKAGDMEKVYELTTKDYKTIGAELIQKVWREESVYNEKKSLFVGARIWQAHQQIVQPFLPKLLNM
jgi:hypothetical protein